MPGIALGSFTYLYTFNHFKYIKCQLYTDGKTEAQKGYVQNSLWVTQPAGLRSGTRTQVCLTPNSILAAFLASYCKKVSACRYFLFLADSPGNSVFGDILIRRFALPP